MFRVGIVGHRYFSNPETTLFVAEQCAAILERAQQQHRDVVAISAIAEGADTLFAEAAVKLKLPLEIVRPFENYADDFASGPAKERYLSLQESARKEVRLSYEARSDLAYKAAMDWVIQQSDLVIIVWDGKPAQGSGGTGDAVKRVTSENRPWVHVDVEQLKVHFHRSAGTLA